MADGDGMLPATWTRKLISGEIQCVEIGFGQIMTTGHIPLWLRLWKSRKLFNKILLPCPRQNCPQMLACFVCCSAWIRPAILNCLVVNVIQKFPKMRSLDLVYVDASFPGEPLCKSGSIFFPGSTGQLLVDMVTTP